jgi:hypothetical protein
MVDILGSDTLVIMLSPVVIRNSVYNRCMNGEFGAGRLLAQELNETQHYDDRLEMKSNGPGRRTITIDCF